MKRAGKTKCRPSGAARHFMSCHKCFGLMLLRCVDPWRRQTSLIVDLASLRLPLPYLERRQAGAGDVRLGARQIACSTEIGAQHVLSAAVGKSGGPFELMFRKCNFFRCVSSVHSASLLHAGLKSTRAHSFFSDGCAEVPKVEVLAALFFWQTQMSCSIAVGGFALGK